MPKLCSIYVQNLCKRGFICREMDVLPCDWAYDASKMSWTHLSLVLVWTATFPLKNEATSHIELMLPYLCWVWMKLRKIMHGVWYHYHEINTRNYPSLTIQFFVKVLLHIQEASVRIGSKGILRLWFGIWVLYSHRMLHITNQVLEVLWPLTLSAKICGHVTWVVCY